MNVKSLTLSGQTPCKSILPSGESGRDLGKILSEKRESRRPKSWWVSPPRSRRDSRQEAESRRLKSRQEISPSSRWDSWREAKSRRPKSRRDPDGNPAEILPGFTAGSENKAAKISAGDPASALGAKRKPGGQNLGGILVVIPPRSRRDSQRGTEIPAAKISAGPGGNPGGIPPRSRWLFYKGRQLFSVELRNRFDALAMAHDNANNHGREQQWAEASVDDCWANTVRIYHDACTTKLGFTQKTNKEWLSDNTWNAINERKKFKGKLMEAKSPRIKERLQAQYTILNVPVKTSAQADKRKFIENLATEAEALARQERAGYSHPANLRKAK